MEFTNLHLCLSGLEKSLLFPGPVRLPGDLLPLARELAMQAEKVKKNDFILQTQGHLFRARRDLQSVDGVWLRLRLLADAPPTLESLPSPLQAVFKNHLLSPHLTKGGVIYITGAPGSGKTTTASATLVSRLRAFGGFACTVEDPPEIPLSGWHGEGETQGYCSQSWVAGDTSADWQEAFRSVLRSQPSNTLTMLFIGEVRDRESASAMIRAASSGFLEIATGFGTDIPSGLDMLSKLAGGDKDERLVHTALANVLRLTIHQRIMNKHLIPRMLVTANGLDKSAIKIRDGDFSGLENDIQHQERLLMRNEDIFEYQLQRGRG